MRIFFDTNVIISAFTTHGVCAEIFNHCLAEHQICISTFVLVETERVLKKKFKLPQNQIKQILNLLKQNTTIVTSKKPKQQISKDPDDDNILADAQMIHAHVLLSGDNDLLELKRFSGIPIIQPKKIWSFEKEKTKKLK